MATLTHQEQQVSNFKCLSLLTKSKLKRKLTVCKGNCFSQLKHFQRQMSTASAKKKAVTEEILSWLDTNYQLSEGVCLPRSLLYSHYSEYCSSKNSEPIGAAAFGKVRVDLYSFIQMPTAAISCGDESPSSSVTHEATLCYSFESIGLRANLFLSKRQSI